MSNNIGNICVVNSGVSESGYVPLSQMVKIIRRISDKTIVISSNTFKKLYEEESESEDIHSFNRINEVSFKTPFKFFFIQIYISYLLILNKNRYRSCVFFIGHHLIIPIFLSKILNKNTLLVYSGFWQNSKESKKTIDLGSVFEVILYVITKVNNLIVDKIILYSEDLINKWDFKKYNHKIIISHRHFLNFSKFKKTKELKEREYMGYIGRFQRKKGIQNLVLALPIILEKNPELKIILIGDGYLFKPIKRFIHKKNLQNQVILKGWVPHEDIPDYLNKIKLLILPSYTEGLPNAILEAMACGTPVLATKVGSIPSIITNDETGYLMENNSPEQIAKDVCNILENEEIEEVSKRSTKFVNDKFNFENVLKNWKKILEDLDNN